MEMYLEEIEINGKKYATEKHIREFLSEKGFATNSEKDPSENGCDIVCIKNGEAFLLEVCTILPDSRCRTDLAKKECDFILCVHHSKRWFFVYPVKDRSLAKITRFYELINQASG